MTIAQNVKITRTNWLECLMDSSKWGMLRDGAGLAWGPWARCQGIHTCWASVSSIKCWVYFMRVNMTQSYKLTCQLIRLKACLSARAQCETILVASTLPLLMSTGCLWPLHTATSSGLNGNTAASLSHYECWIYPSDLNSCNIVTSITWF